MTSNEYKKHTNFTDAENEYLDEQWKNYIDYSDLAKQLEDSVNETKRKSAEAYHNYRQSRIKAIINRYGEPFLDIGSELLVTPGNELISVFEKYNKDFPKNLQPIPVPGDLFYVNGLFLWPGPESVMVQNSDYKSGRISYKEAQQMRKAWLDQQPKDSE